MRTRGCVPYLVPMSKDERSPNLLSTADVADLAGVDVSTVNRWAAAGRIAPMYQGPGRTGVRLYHPTDVVELLQERGILEDELV